MPSLDEFIAFYNSHTKSIQTGDQSALRAILPANIADDHFAFLWQMSLALAEDCNPPEFKIDGDCAIATHRQIEDGNEEIMQREFWFHDGKWISYNPNEVH